MRGGVEEDEAQKQAQRRSVDSRQANQPSIGPNRRAAQWNAAWEDEKQLNEARSMVSQPTLTMREKEKGDAAERTMGGGAAL